VRSLAALGLLLLVVTFTPVVKWWATSLAGSWNEPQGDILIVLSGAGGTSTIGYGDYLRSQYAVLAYRQHPFKMVVVSGGGEPVPQSEMMRDFMAFSGIPRDIIQVETRSTSTRENAVYVTQMLAQQPGTKLLLTSDYHVYRAWLAFQKAGLNVVSSPLPDALKRASRWSDRWPVFFDLLVESCKIEYYKLRRWI
jgi:uncharacterized SAM-binding protein YcdF (DUF218 family)